MGKGQMVLRVHDLSYWQAFKKLDHSLVYIYRTGVLRNRAIDAVVTAAKRSDVGVLKCDPTELRHACLGGSLLPGYHFCDWSGSKQKGKNSDAVIRETLQALSISDEKYVLFVRVGDPFIKHELFYQSVSKAVVIEERLVDSDSIDVTINYLSLSSQLHGTSGVKENEEAISYFRSLVSEEGPFELPEFMQHFTQGVLLYFEPETEEFRFSERQSTSRRAQGVLSRLLTDVIVSRTEVPLLELVRLITDIRSDGVMDEAIIDRLCRATGAVLTSAERKGFPDRFQLDAIVWSGLVLAEIGALRHAAQESAETDVEIDRLITMLDQLGRRFLTMANTNVLRADPLQGAWSKIESWLEDSARSQEDAVTSLHRKLGDSLKLFSGYAVPSWIKRFRDLMDRWEQAYEAGAEQAVDTRRALALPPGAPLLQHLSGQEHIVKGLQGCFASVDHSTPILLYGGEAETRRSWARGYARSLLCDNRHDTDWTACGACGNCVSMDTCNSLSFMELAVQKDSVGTVRNRLQLAFNEPLSRYRVILIDELNHSIFAENAFLQAFEQGRPSTVFILLADRLDGLQPATISRCFSYRVKSPAIK